MLRRRVPYARRGWKQQWRDMPPYLRVLAIGTATIGGVYLASHVEEMPQTGRRRLMLLSTKSEERLGQRAYEEIMHTATVLPSAHPMSRAVLRVGQKIVQFAEAENPDLQWKFHVIEAPEPNAFCLPGGKVFVHTGLFQILQNEDTLAAVLFHEAAHGIARHGAEKVSFSLLMYGLLAYVFPDAGRLGEMLLHVAVDLPYSRKLEYEADSIGLRMMARACYDPRASLQMNAALGRLEKQHAGSSTKYFSTHPPSKERMDAIRSQLRDALSIYEDADCGEKRHAFGSAMSSAYRQNQIW